MGQVENISHGAECPLMGTLVSQSNGLDGRVAAEQFPPVPFKALHGGLEIKLSVWYMDPQEFW